MRLRRSLSICACALVVTLALATGSATADAPSTACAAWDVEYTLAGRLKLTDTPMGEGNGVYSIGPGKLVLRIDDRNGQPGGAVNLVSYDMREYFVIKSKTLFWSTTVTTDTKTKATPDTCSSAAEGELAERKLRWTSKVRGYRTDGVLSCDGSLCGKFGAPPSGESPLHIGPGPVEFKTFDFAPGMKTFTMPATFISKTSMPKQTSFLTLAGREIKRTCAPARPCAPTP